MATLTGETPSFTTPTELLTNEDTPLVFTLIVTDASGIPSVNADDQYGTLTGETPELHRADRAADQ